MTHRYTIILTEEPDGRAFNVRVPAMPGVLTWGRTETEAIDSAREAIGLHLESYRERGEPVPEDRRPQAALGSAPRVILTRVEIEELAGAHGSR
jgi:antitoxin HicB